jgi:hypothetical protein
MISSSLRIAMWDVIASNMRSLTLALVEGVCGKLVVVSASLRRAWAP